MKGKRQIGIESSSIMPLIEITPRTQPLQREIERVTSESNWDIQFFTDRYSLIEVRQQINTSFNNAIKSVQKAKLLAEELNMNTINRLTICVVKCLAENWYGREETLRWSDVLYVDSIRNFISRNQFFEILNNEMNRKKQIYLSFIPEGQESIYINCSNIQSYWETPKYTSDLKIQINVINNKISLETFFTLLVKELNDAYMNTFKMNDLIDIYHLYSLYYDGGINEIWSCNQRFVKRHEKYLKDLKDFEVLFDKKEVTIFRIK